ncbi:cold shock domain-containing protein [Kitasatospora acidiphila]|uniref:Cold shock domain-containing protein n=1 Tax=Kitasatospora acidiphila TaxID=2567942 RepID=A0A540WE75_9ACTN|nr:cold shock domain-containing protein [Kitasatospora acidiphila]TQF06714.1 cold shock domain-containing protein [Kitasatospora acidiphila]
MASTGHILRFDEVRGYGFIAPDEGGEDLFMHANDLLGEKHLFRAGLAVSFDAEQGERGMKASRVRLVDAPPREGIGVQRPPVAVIPPWATREETPGDNLCDVLSSAEFQHELTETLLTAAPTLTGTQILAIRKALVDLSRQHNWIEG